MESLEYYNLLEKVSSLSEESKMMLIYKLIESLNEDITQSLTEDANKMIISPCVIVKTIILMGGFESILRQLYERENRVIARDDIENSDSYILR